MSVGDNNNNKIGESKKRSLKDWDMGIYVLNESVISGKIVYKSEKEENQCINNEIMIINHNSYLKLNKKIINEIYAMKSNEELVLVYFFGMHPIEKDKGMARFRKYFFDHCKQIDWITFYELEQKFSEVVVVVKE